MTLKEYISELNRQMATGRAGEHSYRPALKQLLDTALPGFDVTNEPRRIACGAPDFIIMRHSDGLPAAFVETKDIGDADLDGRREHREQFDRYRASLDRIVFTDYLDFHFYEGGQLTERVRLGELQGGRITPAKDAYDRWAAAMARLAGAGPQRITSAQALAAAMAAKARLLGDVIGRALDEERPGETPDDGCGQIVMEYKAFREVLISTLSYAEFADIYSQTIVYGMFAARLHDTTPDTFSRFEAATLIPKTNPFLRKIFQNIAGYDLDGRIAWIVDDVASMFRAADLRRIMADYAGPERRRDPMIHFYEDFLRAYRPAVKKEKGVWYTPLPVVRFMVAAVDSVLATDFGLPQGLADYSMVEREVANSQYDPRRRGERKTYRLKFHKLQILDPATGTGTFLAEVVNRIHDKFSGQQGLWQQYVEQHLLPRLNGFELLMAPYTVAHLKLDMVLRATGYEHNSDRRLNIFLTNSLEEPHPYTSTLFAKWLSDEANAANRIKRDTPVMVLIGNPPYNGESRNKGEWIMSLMETYKREPGGKARLAERNPKWLNDDYVKFIRLAQHFIEKNGEGVLAFINPHGFLDNPTFRGMRWSLLRAFDKIYTIDLHGNSKKKETAPDGGKDENVFDIQQGVSINLLVKTGRKAQAELGRVCHFDLFGRRQDKLDYLAAHTLNDIPFTDVTPREPMYFFVPKDFGAEEEYRRGFGVNELFVNYLLGPNSHRDDFAISFDLQTAQTRIKNFADKDLQDTEVAKMYDLKDNRDWKIADARRKMTGNEKAVKCLYRPFDFRYMLYGDFAFDYLRPQINDSLLKPNIALITTKQTKENFSAFASNVPLGQHKIVTPYDGSYIFPLFFYSKSELDRDCDNSKLPNLNNNILKKIKDALKENQHTTGLPQIQRRASHTVIPRSDAESSKQPGTLDSASGRGMTDSETRHGTHHDIKYIDGTQSLNSKESEEFTIVELFDYIYAVLHSHSYRERYKEFLKIDFPRIPYPTDRALFHRLAEKGAELRRTHLMDGSAAWAVSTTYPEPGANTVEQVRHDGERVWINDTQYFGGVSPEAWNFFIGGYQPAQKWLKDRRGRTLDFAAIRHYEEIIHALCATVRLMREIDALPLPWRQ